MLNALSVALRDDKPDGVARAAASMRRQGFVHALHFDWEGGALDAWSHPSQLASGNAELRTPAGCAVCVGPLWYRGRFGRAALPGVIEDIEARGSLDEMQLRGNFALFVHVRGHCILMNDALGFVRINASPDAKFHCTSWLATCAYAGPVEIDEAAAIEYVLLGASHSDATVARGVTTLPLASTLDLDSGRLRKRLPAGFWEEGETPASPDAAVAQLREHLLAVFREAGAATGGKVRAALSGGFDSRLILAGLLAAGARPELFVYGAADSPDVKIAQAVAASVDLPIEVIDKRDIERGLPEPDLERLVQNALFFDGLPNDGIWDRGADQQTRLAQTAGGALTQNGGGGEIFRNFFHLPDRPLHALDVVRSFYRGFDKKVFRRPGALDAYNERMVSSMQRVLGIDAAQASRKLTRAQVELLYPLFRCHHSMSVNNSAMARHGNYVTPLIDIWLTRLTHGLPLAWKGAGALQARTLTALHSDIAAQQSAYGFRFSEGPDRRARRNEWMTCMRPVMTRPAINAMRRRVQRECVSPETMSACRRMLPGAWRLDEVLDLAALPDDRAFARALAIEVAWRGVMA